MLDSIAIWLEGLALPTAIRESAWLFPIFETLHVLGLALVFGSIAMVDLRLLGVANRGQSPWSLAQRTLPWTWMAFIVTVVSGALLFASSAVRYIDNPAFQLKLLLLALAGLNMAAFQFGASRSMSIWPNRSTPMAAKVAGGLSLVFWIGVIAAGRWIGFVNTNPF
jgi:hypothetical protein